MVSTSPRASHSTSSSTIVAMAGNHNSRPLSIWHRRTIVFPPPSATPAITSPKRLPRKFGGSRRDEPTPVQSRIPGTDRHHAREYGGKAPRRYGPRSPRSDHRTCRTHRRGGWLRRRGEHAAGVHPHLRTAASIDQARNSKLGLVKGKLPSRHSA